MQEMKPAPEFAGGTGWIHSSPLTMASLRGKVVAVEFWTHGCSHCVHAAPRLQNIVDEFGSRGFVLIGVHTPEFPEEKDAAAVKGFLMHQHLSYPVVLDHDQVLWKAYGNEYWPTLYLIDKQGYIRATHIGDGGYEKIKQEIEHLLAE